MRYPLERFAHMFALFFVAATLCMSGAGRLAAQETREQSDAEQIIQFLQNNPENRPARWAIAQMAYQAQRYDIAMHHVQRLLRTSKSEQDLQTLTSALAEITAVDPWDYNLNFAVLPSSNIRRYTYNDRFETDLGIFTPAGSGNEESGLGFSIGAGLSYALSLPDNSRLSLNAQVDHNLYDSSDLDQTRLSLSASRTSFGIRTATTFQPYLRLRYDEDLTLDRRDIGFNLSRTWWLEEDAQFDASALLEDRDYLLDDVLNGPYGRSRVHYDYALNDRTRLGIGAAIARSEPQREHLRYWEGQLSTDASRLFEGIGSVGLFGSYTMRRYDAFFPATSLIREDETFSVGVSYQHDSFKLFGSRPQIMCQFERNSSNIALYDYETIDCGLTFERSF